MIDQGKGRAARGHPWLRGPVPPFDEQEAADRLAALHLALLRMRARHQGDLQMCENAAAWAQALADRVFRLHQPKENADHADQQTR